MNLTLPNIELLTGENRYKIFKDGKIGTKATDFAKASGVNGIIRQRDGLLANNEAYALTSKSSSRRPIAINYNSHLFSFKPNSRNIGIRLMLSFSDLCSYCFEQKINENGHIYQAKAFLFPKDIVNKELAEELEEQFQEELLIKPELYLTTDSYPNDSLYPFFPKTNPIYKYNKKLYTKYLINTGGKSLVLSNNEEYTNGKIAWFEVKPIDFTIKQSMNIAISNDIILGGIPFNLKPRYNGHFEKTDIKYYLNSSLEPFLKESGKYMKKKLK